MLTHREDATTGNGAADWNVWGPMPYWAVGEMASRTGGDVKRTVEIPSTMERYLCVECWWFGQYEPNEMGAICN